MREKSVLLIAFLVLVAIGVGSFFIPPATISTPVEAQSPERFQFQAVGKWGFKGEVSNTTHFVVAAICDTATGNLIYIPGASQSGLSVVPNGCQKNPQ